MEIKMVLLVRRFQKHIQGYEYVGVDVFDDQKVQVYHEYNPREIDWESCTCAEFLAGRLNDEVGKALGDEKLKEVREYLNSDPFQSRPAPPDPQGFAP